MGHKSLYRDTENGKIAGVCAGIANYFGLEIWLVRIAVVSAALLGGSFLVLLAYIAFALMLERQPYDLQQQTQASREHQVKNKPWQAGETPEMVINNIDAELEKIEKRLQEMEAYVTSDAFKLNREFRQL